MSKSKMNYILTVLFLLTKVFITLSLCNGNQSNTIEIKPNKPLKEIRIKRSTNSNKIQALLDGANYLDHEIYRLESELPDLIETARLTIREATREENKLAVSYGLSIIAANVLYTANVIWDKNVTDFTFVDWGTIAANTGYAWGYSGLWLVDGQLESPDPGCGIQDLYDAQDSTPVPSLHSVYDSVQTSVPTYQPAIMRQAVLERDLAVRRALSCIQDDVSGALDKLKSAYLTRIDVTQTILDSIYS